MNIPKAMIEETKEQAIRDKEIAISVGGHSCYGAGVEQGIIECCDKFLDYMNDLSYM